MGKMPRLVLRSVAAYVSGFSLFMLSVLPSHAYDKTAHKMIVEHAIDYMMSSSDEAIAYIDYTTPKTDYELLRQTLVPHLHERFLVETEIKNQAKAMGDLAESIDRMHDIHLNICAFSFGIRIGCAVTPEFGNYSFTMFSHFLNVRDGPVFFKHRGYSYTWVKSNKNRGCAAAGFKDYMVNVFIEDGEGIFDFNASSTPLNRYRQPLRELTTIEEADRQFKQTIPFIEFWPLTNVVRYWWEDFLRVNERSSKDHLPYNLNSLGPVLHAVADSTVPFHATGLSGCGHVEYETNIETWMEKGMLYDKKSVRTWLTNHDHLSRDRTMEELLLGNARYAGDEIHCKCDPTGCHCPIVKNIQVGRDLINLAIASTVVTLRKAFSEWLPQRKQEKPAEVKILEPTRTYAWGVATWSDEAFASSTLDDWEFRTIDPPAIDAPNAERAKSTKQVLTGKLSDIKETVLNYKKGRMNQDEFKRNTKIQIDEAAEIVGSQPALEWTPSYKLKGVSIYEGLPPIGPPPKRFRNPELDEIQDPQKWATYLKQRDSFDEAEALYLKAERTAYSESQLIKK